MSVQTSKANCSGVIRIQQEDEGKKKGLCNYGGEGVTQPLLTARVNCTRM